MFGFSTDLGSMQNTKSFFVPVIQFVFSDLSEAQLTRILVVIRKSAHLIEYGILAALWFFVFSRSNNWFTSRPALFALLISIVYAGLDELHQAFTHSRTGSFFDVGIDTVGAMMGLVLVKGKTIITMSASQKKKAKCFGWWFAWGGFSTIMVLIVMNGGPFVFWQMIFLTLGVGSAAGIGGILVYARHD